VEALAAEQASVCTKTLARVAAVGAEGARRVAGQA